MSKERGALAATVRQIAEAEIKKEEFRRMVDAEKERIRAKRSLLDRLFPWVISIRRK